MLNARIAASKFPVRDSLRPVVDRTSFSTADLFVAAEEMTL
jgi:hypothetical protein